MVRYAKSALLFLLSPLIVAPRSTARGETVEWTVLDEVKLPQPLSDNSATFVAYTQTDADSSSSKQSKLGGDRILIAGGCNSPDGNTHVDSTGYVLDFFICESTSDKVYAFDPDGGTFVPLADMPRPRYRHAGVEIGGKVWLVGGRSVPDDSIIAEIDVYDPISDSWSTPGSLPDEYLTSDNAAFTDRDGNHLYVVGGYNPTYDNPSALATTFTIDVKEALMNGNIVIADKAPLSVQRGDVHAVNTADYAHAYVTGGFSMYPCEPLNSVEMYDITADAWTTVDSLNSARGDKALIQLNNKIYAVGGETTPKDQCADNPDDIPPLSAQSVAVDDVEVLDPAMGASAAWTTIDDIPNFRFRFSGAAWDKTDTVYLFGGQDGFDAECKCFPTSDTVAAYRLGSEGSSTLSSSSGSSRPKRGGMFYGFVAVMAGAKAFL